MAKKKKPEKESTIENYYDLKIDKVNELVSALKDDNYQPEDEVNYDVGYNTGVEDPSNYTRSGKSKQFDPYKRDFLSRLPVWFKAVFIKWWFAGVVAYFVVWGLGYYLTFGVTNGELDVLFITGLVSGIIVDCFVNPIFRYIETDRHEYNAYIMFPFPFKAFWTFFANIIYYIIVSVIVALFYGQLNMAGVSLGVEPLLFGTFAVVVDMAFIGIKDGVVALVRHLKNKKKENALNV